MAGERAKAIRDGSKRYFTGKPCQRGHLSERDSRSSTCLACERETGSRRSLKEWDVLREQRRARYELNPEPARERARKRYKKMREAMLCDPGLYESYRAQKTKSQQERRHKMQAAYLAIKLLEQGNCYDL